VPPVFAQMGRDAVRASRFSYFRGANRIGVSAAAGLAHSCYMIDVHA
jgi:hypothetical protein